MNITLSPAKTTKVTAEFNGGEFTFEFKNFTIQERQEFENIVQDVIDNDGTMSDLHKAQWQYSITNCSLENPLEVIPYTDIQKILNLVNKTNLEVDEKKS